MTETKLTLKEMCAKFDVTPRTLRYYEYIELLFPQKDGRKRLYGTVEFARMELILRGRRFGFSLESIRQWLEMYNTENNNSAQMETWIEMASRQIKELESRRVQLDETIDELTSLRDHASKYLPK